MSHSQKLSAAADIGGDVGTMRPSNPHVVVFGDWHGNVRWAQRMVEKAAAATSAEVFYHVGDFGLWGLAPETFQASRDGGEGTGPSDGYRYLDAVNTVLARHGRELWVVLGNHENYDELERMPADSSGVRKHPQFPNIVFLPRSFVWEDPVSGKLFGCVGGAGSIDRVFRVEHESWWPQEEVTFTDLEVFKNLPRSGDVEVFFSHDAPAGSGTVDDTRPPDYATPDVLQYCHRQRMLLRDALDWARPQIGFHGHWHTYAENVVAGVGFDGQEYSARMFSLGMDGTAENAVVYRTGTGQVVPLR